MYHHWTDRFSISRERVTHQREQGGGVGRYPVIWPRRKMELLNNSFIVGILTKEKKRVSV